MRGFRHLRPRRALSVLGAAAAVAALLVPGSTVAVVSHATDGATDDFGYRSVEDVVTLHDLHATMLHLFGIDHNRFSVKFQGLDARLTGVEPARVVKAILA